MPKSGPRAHEVTPQPTPPTFPETFSLIRRTKAKAKKPSREFMRALHTALPDLAGMGGYWRDEILSGREAWPPVPTSTPARECRRRGDRGRLYPGYYVREHAATTLRRGTAADQVDPPADGETVDRSRRFYACEPAAMPKRKRTPHRRQGFVCCLDCSNEIWLRDRINWEIYQGTVQADGIAVDEEEARASAGPDADGSASAAALTALAESGATLIESRLAPEDEPSLRRQMARYQAGAAKVVIIHPFAEPEW